MINFVSLINVAVSLLTHLQSPDDILMYEQIYFQVTLGLQSEVAVIMKTDCLSLFPAFFSHLLHNEKQHKQFT